MAPWSGESRKALDEVRPLFTAAPGDFSTLKEIWGKIHKIQSSNGRRAGIVVLFVVFLLSMAAAAITLLCFAAAAVATYYRRCQNAEDLIDTEKLDRGRRENNEGVSGYWWNKEFRPLAPRKQDATGGAPGGAAGASGVVELVSGVRGGEGKVKSRNSVTRSCTFVFKKLFRISYSTKRPETPLGRPGEVIELVEEVGEGKGAGEEGKVTGGMEVRVKDGNVIMGNELIIGEIPLGGPLGRPINRGMSWERRERREPRERRESGLQFDGVEDSMSEGEAFQRLERRRRALHLDESSPERTASERSGESGGVRMPPMVRVKSRRDPDFITQSDVESSKKSSMDTLKSAFRLGRRSSPLE